MLALETRMFHARNDSVRFRLWFWSATLSLLWFPLSASAGGPGDLGAVLLLASLIQFYLLGAVVAGVVAICAAPNMRLRSFWYALLLWLPFCMLLVWSPSIVSVAYAWIVGDTWGSFSGDFPGYWNQLTRYIAVNHLIPEPSVEQLAIALAAIVGITLFARFRSSLIAAAVATLILSVVMLLPNAREPFRAERCLELGSHYNYVVEACGSGPFPYLPRHERHPIPTLLGVASGLMALSLFVVGIRVSNKRLQMTRETRAADA